MEATLALVECEISCALSFVELDGTKTLISNTDNSSGVAVPEKLGRKKATCKTSLITAALPIIDIGAPSARKTGSFFHSKMPNALLNTPAVSSSTDSVQKSGVRPSSERRAVSYDFAASEVQSRQVRSRQRRTLSNELLDPFPPSRSHVQVNPPPSTSWNSL